MAGTDLAPLVLWLGQRSVGRIPGLIGTALLMTLSPYTIFFSGSGRSYKLMPALLMGSALLSVLYPSIVVLHAPCRVQIWP